QTRPPRRIYTSGHSTGDNSWRQARRVDRFITTAADRFIITRRTMPTAIRVWGSGIPARSITREARTPSKFRADCFHETRGCSADPAIPMDGGEGQGEETRPTECARRRSGGRGRYGGAQIFAVEAGDVGDGDRFRAGRLAFVGVGAAAESFFVH